MYITPPRTLATSKYASTKASKKKSVREKIISMGEVATM
jgi:hypothetical protein